MRACDLLDGQMDRNRLILDMDPPFAGCGLAAPWTPDRLDPCPAELPHDEAILQGDTTSRLKHEVRQGDRILSANPLWSGTAENRFPILQKPEMVVTRPSLRRHSPTLCQLRR